MQRLLCLGLLFVNDAESQAKSLLAVRAAPSTALTLEGVAEAEEEEEKEEREDTEKNTEGDIYRAQQLLVAQVVCALR